MLNLFLATMGDITTESGGNRGKILNAQLVVDGSSGKYRNSRNVATVYSHPLSLEAVVAVAPHTMATQKPT